MIQLKTEDDILVDRPPFKQMIVLKHIAYFHYIIRIAVSDKIAFVVQVSLFRCKESGDDGEESRFDDGTILETLDSRLVIVLKVFKDMSSTPDFDMDKICDRLRYSLRKNRISNMKAAKDLGVSRDLIFDYTNPNYLEKSMQVKTLIKFASYLGEEKYYFCNEYHRFLDTVDVGAFLKELRRKHAMTQKQFADYLEIPYYRYKTYESVKCKLPQEVFEGLKREEELG